MQVDPDIFKANDIRGVYPDALNDAVAYAVGRAFVTLLMVDTVVVGRDMRLSSPPIFNALTQGLIHGGADVLDIGMVSTDQYYYACATLDLAGIMVTASHNPPQYGGLKMVKRMPHIVSGDMVQDLRDIIETDAFVQPVRTGKMVEKVRDIDPSSLTEGFIEKILSLIDVDALIPMKVITDTGNGMVGPILKRIYSHLPTVELTGMYLEPDGNLPNHGPDPLQPENRAELQRRVVTEGADIGFAFDGDGDRCFAVDDRGEFVSSDFLSALIGQYLLESNPGAKMMYAPRCSHAVRDLITDAGGIALTERVGHAIMKQRLAQEDALFATEGTGHYYFRDFFYADSGILPSLIVMEMLSKKRSALSDLLKPLESTYFISGEINTPISADPTAKMEEIVKVFGKGGEVEWLDGISISFGDWRFNVRPSNTEPLLRLNLEATSKELMEQKRDAVLKVVQAGSG
ncbi:phosphomannomutase/phosphoglucomutase [Candidatus Poribacteria bacterium]|nr:MAG: phosphomannomutase/phosphoglucomutase [Candidatus Poribacteria bacterium]